MKPQNDKKYVFIDAQNVYKGAKSQNWNLDWRKFRIYLADKYRADKVFLFIGYLSQYQGLYSMLQESGYILIFKPTITRGDGEVKGNVDAELIVECWRREKEYTKAIIVTGDGDFTPLISILKDKQKFDMVIAPNLKYSSSLLRKAAGSKILFMDEIKGKVQRRVGVKNEKTP